MKDQRSQLAKDMDRAMNESSQHTKRVQEYADDSEYDIGFALNVTIMNDDWDDVEAMGFSNDDINYALGLVEKNVVAALKKNGWVSWIQSKGHGYADELIGSATITQDMLQSIDEMWENTSQNTYVVTTGSGSFWAVVEERDAFKGVKPDLQEYIDIELEFMDVPEDMLEACGKPHSKKKKISPMAETGSGRRPGDPAPSVAPFRRSGQVRSVEGLKVGDLLIQPNDFGPGENLVKITQKPEADRAYGMFMDPSNPSTPRNYSDREFVIYNSGAKKMFYAESIKEIYAGHLSVSHSSPRKPKKKKLGRTSTGMFKREAVKLQRVTGSHELKEGDMITDGHGQGITITESKHGFVKGVSEDQRGVVVTDDQFITGMFGKVVG